jgi:hypothetical protein
MGNGLLSRVNWGGTLVFMLIRIAFGTVGLFIFFLLTGGLQGASGLQGANILGLPFAVVILSGMSLVAGWLSQQGLPFAGLVSMVCSIPMYIGDPMVWVLHKVRPQWVPVAEPGFINPPLVWVLNE